MIPEPHVTLQGERIPSAITKIVLCRILFIFFCFLNAVWASTSDGFRIVCDTLRPIVIIIIIIIIIIQAFITRHTRTYSNDIELEAPAARPTGWAALHW